MNTVVSTVALRKESVDRNKYKSDLSLAEAKVALRKESVDRNVIWSTQITSPVWSLSARRAWIEMSC